jgi:hypothetical protein
MSGLIALARNKQPSSLTRLEHDSESWDDKDFSNAIPTCDKNVAMTSDDSVLAATLATQVAATIANLSEALGPSVAAVISSCDRD